MTPYSKRTTFDIDGLNNGQHSVRHDHHHPPNQSAILIPKGLELYGREIATLLRLDDEITRCFDAMAVIENQLREYGCTPPRPDLSGQLRAAWSHHRGEGFWER